MAYLNGCRGTETFRQTAPSYSGLVRCPLTAVTRVRIPLGSHNAKALGSPRAFVIPGVDAAHTGGRSESSRNVRLRSGTIMIAAIAVP